MDEQENKNMFIERENKEQDFSQNGQDKPNRNIVGVIVLVIVLLVGGYFVFKNSGSKRLKPQEIIPKPLVTPEVARISEDRLQKELPQDFLKEIPLNGKVKIIESYSATYPNSTVKQSTISF